MFDKKMDLLLKHFHENWQITNCNESSMLEDSAKFLNSLRFDPTLKASLTLKLIVHIPN